MSVPLILTTFTHLWNPIGFPDIFYDEGIYMRRALHVLEGLGPQESYFYDHPFFGQLFLAAMLGIIGYPDSVNPDSGDIRSIEVLYIVPRIIIGILAVIDTLIIYKIAELHYNWKVALFASILYAVMPMTWLTRRILLDSILLPFLLSSILFAIYLRNSNYKFVPILISGISLGLAIFTKIPIVTLIPLVAFLIFKNSNKNLKLVGLWFIPVILIPLIWPAHAASLGQFDLWFKDIIWQMQRQNSGFISIVTFFFLADPVLLILSSAGIVFAAVEKNYFLLLWIIPFVIFLSVIGFVQYFYWIPILPAFCIAAAIFTVHMLEKIVNPKIRRMLLFSITSGILIFGLVNNTILIITDITGQFQAAAFTFKYLQENNDDDDNNNNNYNVTLISSPVYSWIFNYVFNKENVVSDYRDLLYSPAQTKGILLIADPHFKSNIASGGGQLHDIYENTTVIATFKGDVFNFDLHKYPYTNMVKNYEGSIIELRIRR
jgi:hypothetical protein